MAQHLAALKAVAAVSGGNLEGGELGATEIRFEPGPIRGGDYEFHVGTAGSISLVLQALLPVVLHADGVCHLHITGGTDVRMAPPWDYLQRVFLPWLAQMGVALRVDSVRHGYYPKGGGEVKLTVQPCARPRSLLAERGGTLQAIEGVAHVAQLPMHIPQRMASAAASHLSHLGAVHIETKVLNRSEAFGTGGAMVLVAQTDTGRLGAATVAERGLPAERLGEDAGRALRAELDAGAGVDVHAADQLLIYAAQAREASHFSVRDLTLHAQTVMWLIEQFLPARFHVQSRDGLQYIAVSPS